MKIRLTTDFLTGVLFLALGGFAIIYGSRYAVGTAARMGPGYFPLIASSGIVLLGIVLVVRSLLRGGEGLGSVHVRPLALVLLGTFLFGLTIERFGLLVAGSILVIASRLADRDFRIVEVGLLALGLVLLAAGIFQYGLGLPALRLLPF
jgi:hypothetical protein